MSRRLDGSERGKGTAFAAFGFACFFLMIAGCSSEHGVARPQAGRPAGRVGVDPISVVHLMENHSSALIAWRRAGMSDRVVVHLDGHIDVDWLPDETVARIAAASPQDLPELELHPYAMGGATLSGFGIWNFLYPAARVGVMRELVWVVPDGSLSDRAHAAELVRRRLLDSIQMVPVSEIWDFHVGGRIVQGTLLGIPLTICELRDLPQFREPVLLDIDLDFFTTESAVTQKVPAAPWIAPRKALAILRDRGLRTDLVTVSLSTFGGYLPPDARWLGPSTVSWLKSPGSPAEDAADERIAAATAEGEGKLEKADKEYRRLLDRFPKDAPLWYALSRSLEASGRTKASREALRRAAELDPLLAHAWLFEADRLWIDSQYSKALREYRAYAKSAPGGPFDAYVHRRIAGCLSRLGRTTEAIAEFRKVVNMAPDHGDSHMDLGVLLRDTGHLEEALEQFRAARRILPDRANYAMALGTSALLAGRLDEGFANLEDAVRLRPVWAAARTNLVVALLQAGRLDDAASNLSIAMTLAPGDRRLRLVAAQLRRQGRDVHPVSRKP